MNSIILCEGNDDVWMIGYFLHKACNCKWNYVHDTKISDNFDLPIPTKRSISEVYTNGTDNVVIHSVGGKDSFRETIEFVLKINNRFPEERFQQVVIVRDRDFDSTENILGKLKSHFEEFSDSNYALQQNVILKDRESVSVKYTSKENEYTFNIAVIIIPFDCEGALETVLTKSISYKGAEEKLICDLANTYVDNYMSSLANPQYITKKRDEIKSKFSTVMAVINPSSSTDKMNEIFMEFEWEKSPYIQENFKLLIDLFS